MRKNIIKQRKINSSTAIVATLIILVICSILTVYFKQGEGVYNNAVPKKSMSSLSYTCNAKTGALTVKDGNKTLGSSNYSCGKKIASNKKQYQYECTGKGSYTGTTTRYCYIPSGKKDVSLLSFTCNSVGNILIKDGSKTLGSSDYSCNKTINSDGIHYKYECTGKGSYTGTTTKYCYIPTGAKKELNSLKYTCNTKTGALIVKDGSKTLGSSNYSCGKTIAPNKKQYKYECTGKGSYTGTTTRYCYIPSGKKELNSLKYTCNAKTGALTVKDGNKTLGSSDYSCGKTIAPNKKQYQYECTGKGSYTGTTTRYCYIPSGKKELNSLKYTCNAKTGALTVKDGNKTLGSSDYSCTKIISRSRYAYTCTGKGSYTGTTTKYCEIPTSAKKELNSLKYTCNAKTGALTVKDGNKTLGSSDYSCTKIISRSRYAYTCTGKGSYTGTTTKYCEIPTSAKKELNSLKYTCNAKTGALTVKDGNKTLGSSDYSCTKIISRSRYAYTCTGKGSYTGTTTKYCEIPTSAKKDVSSLSFTCNSDGNIAIKDGSKMLGSSDYSCTKIISGSRYAYTCTGKGSYTGTTTTKYCEIPTSAKKDVSLLSFTCNSVGNILIKDGNKTLGSSDCSCNKTITSDGKHYKYTCTGKGSYTGTTIKYCYA